MPRKAGGRGLRRRQAVRRIAERNRFAQRGRVRRRNRAEVRDRVRGGIVQGNPVEPYKIALKSDILVETQYLGRMEWRCANCDARHYECERTGRDTDLFTQCCEKGKFILRPYRESVLLKDLLSGNHRYSVEYKKNIRRYNAALAMISTGLHCDEFSGAGPYYLRVHGGVYHQIGPLIPDNGVRPSYAQLYIYDTDEGATLRMGDTRNVECEREVMVELAEHIQNINQFAWSFKAMHVALQTEPGRQKDVRMFIFEDKVNDPRRYNLPSTTDVAAVFESANGEPPVGDRHLIVRPFGSEARTVCMQSSNTDPLAYVLLFPYGDSGWHINMEQNNPRTGSQTRVTQNKYASYRLSVREECDNFHRSEKLFLQWIVDMYVRIETERLSYIRFHQSELRRDMYVNLFDFVQQQAGERDVDIGSMVVLPSSFIGSPRNMNERYHDAMCIVREYGKPDLFITFTCNPKWREVTEELSEGEMTYFRPDIISRVFHAKLKGLIEDIMKRRVFGNVAAVIYTIEFQKRGLPHAHILISLREDDKIRDVTDVDKFVSAEIPDERDPLYPIVAAHMMHGPCGSFSSATRTYPCSDDAGNCKKKFPRDWEEETRQHPNGYPIYRRRRDGRVVEKMGRMLDNRWVVAHNRYLLLKYDAHINVEVCTTVKSVKYIYKYIYKGYDACTVEMNMDEIRKFVDARYVGSVEAAWRIFEFELHFQSVVIYRLNCHLQDMQMQTFARGNEDAVVADPPNTKLLAWFQLNERDDRAKQYLYTEIPQHYTWNSADQKWNRRKANSGQRVLTRLYAVNPKNTELFYLRMLLLHVRGATSFVDLRTYEGHIYDTFHEACVARNIIVDDRQWEMALAEASETKSPKQMRQLFSFIVALNNPECPARLWETFKNAMSEDFVRSNGADAAENMALIDIDDILVTHNTACATAGLPVPNRISNEVTVGVHDIQENERIFANNYHLATEQQRKIIDEVIGVLDSECEHGESKIFYLDAPAGCGKTFIQDTLRAYMRGHSRQCIVACYTGIAASLISGGRTLHNVFHLPVPLLETSVPDISYQSPHAERLRQCEMLIIDEASMVPSVALTVIDRLLRDLTKNNRPFGNKILFMSGDFRQTLPVVPHGGRELIVESCLKRNPLWRLVRQFELTRNLRLEPGEDVFASYLLTVGNGTLPRESEDGSPYAAVVSSELRGFGSPVEFVYDNVEMEIEQETIVGKAILAPLNKQCTELNSIVLEKLAGDAHTYASFDTVISDNSRDHVDFPVEFLNTLEVSGLPPHRLVVKKNAIVMLLRNLHTASGLINGTRLQVVDMLRHTVECKVLTGTGKGNRVLIPRISISPSTTTLPIALSRCQFPLNLAFAMTINKSQGQTLSTVALCLKEPVFGHGQLYVALSRVRSFNQVKIFADEGPQQRFLRNGDILTKNVVYPEVL